MNCGKTAMDEEHGGWQRGDDCLEAREASSEVGSKFILEHRRAKRCSNGAATTRGLLSESFTKKKGKLLAWRRNIFRFLILLANKIYSFCVRDDVIGKSTNFRAI